MAAVYIWKNTQHTGHASISIGGEYISFHPNLSNNQNCTKEQKLDYNRRHHVDLTKIAENEYYPFFTSREDDVETYGSWVDKVSLNDLDEDSVAEYLSGDFDRDHPVYGLRSCNCSTVVVTLLLLSKHEYVHDGSWMGTMATKMRHMNKILYDDHSRESRDYHDRRFEEVGDHVEHMAPIFLRFAARRGAPIAKMATSIVSGLDFTRRALFWTPGDVLHMANYFHDH